jgi:hypothetical protein
LKGSQLISLADPPVVGKTRYAAGGANSSAASGTGPHRIPLDRRIAS